MRQNKYSPNEVKQLSQRGELQQTVNNSFEATKLFFNMGVMIEQYRARIGTHNNFIKTKEGTSHLGENIFNRLYCLCCTIIENGK